MIRFRYWLPLLAASLLSTTSSQAADPSGEALAYFENHVRPVFIEHCIECHGPQKSESGLRLDTRETALRGGDSGPAVMPGRPEESLILKALRHQDGLEMPPDGSLNEREIAAIERWILDGAVWPEMVQLGGEGPVLRSGPITQEERRFWSFQPVVDPSPPAVDDTLRVQNEIDQFLQERLSREGLAMRPAANKRTLLRRATFDLVGLPPTPDEMDAFLKDDSPNAFAKVVDRLLASSAYGERWGRHWLDVVRYADTAGETADYPTPLSYKYRNWVINAFNADMPYDEFVRQQIAGDILAGQMIERLRKASEGSESSAGQPSESAIDEATLTRYREMFTATGFIAISRRFGFDVENYHHLTIQDTIDVAGQAVLGLTLGCARCHDHKYDPVSMADYYAWYGIFESTRYSFPGSEEKKRPYDLFPAYPRPVVEQRQLQFDEQLASLETELERVEAELKDASGSAAAESLQMRVAELTAQRDLLKRSGPFSPDELIYGAVESEMPADARIQLRGEKSKPGDVAPRRNLEILGGEMLPVAAGSGRLQMAEWLTGHDNPLFRRVMVNRIWQHHFGRGLVGTENDFGARGERPSHPELLDWLASRFQESGYSVKAMHRLIMNSAAYQQSSADDAVAAERDPENRLLWRFSPRRLSAEEIRDAMLLVGGNLDRSMGGQHPFPPVETWGFTQHNPFYEVFRTNRRSVYLMQQRLKRDPFLALFDGADGNVSTARRELTTTPTQSLYLMNNPFVHEQAAGLVKRVFEGAAKPADRLDLAWRIALSRSPHPEEVNEAMDFLLQYGAKLSEQEPTLAGREMVAWKALARTLLTRNEFLFVD